ncbi:hypothetical protein PISL3812_09181 [Talaromyces islandicus]|uniref:Uncharacterized protein n=1 Tax=Talaromyces islandicus TaxID=28573 RepID=A0A0U1M981_TALIS|nr:hypothetical protein PISL3812_09181 [Talaromyces islandicus]
MCRSIKYTYSENPCRDLLHVLVHSILLCPDAIFSQDPTPCIESSEGIEGLGHSPPEVMPGLDNTAEDPEPSLTNGINCIDIRDNNPEDPESPRTNGINGIHTRDNTPENIDPPRTNDTNDTNDTFGSEYGGITVTTTVETRDGDVSPDRQDQ